MAHRAVLEFDCIDSASARRLVAALEVEAHGGPEGTATGLDARDALLRVTIEAETVSTLRAAVNNIIRLADTARRVQGASGSHNP